MGLNINSCTIKISIMLLRKDFVLPQFEVSLNGPSVPDRLKALPPQSTVEITFLPPKNTGTYSPSEKVSQLITACRRVSDLGYKAYPHLAARALNNDSLDLALKGLDGLADRVFLIAGDFNPQDPPLFPDSVFLAREIFKRGNPFSDIGFAVYPDYRHPAIDKLRLKEAAADKNSLAREHPEVNFSFQTQFCFKPGEIVKLGQNLKQSGIEIPIDVGVLVPAGLKTLRRLISLIGYNALDVVLQKPDLALAVGVSIIQDKLPVKAGDIINSFFPKFLYRPENFIEKLLTHPDLDQTNIRGIYFYTMNNFQGSAGLYQSLTN